RPERQGDLRPASLSDHHGSGPPPGHDPPPRRHLASLVTYRPRRPTARLAHRAPPLGRLQARLHRSPGEALADDHPPGPLSLPATEESPPMTDPTLSTTPQGFAVALSPRPTAADEDRHPIDHILANLTAYVAGRGWEIA